MSMKVLLVEPLGHIGGHESAHTGYLVRALADAGVDVTLLTFKGRLGSSSELDAKVVNISFTSNESVLVKITGFLSHLFPAMFHRFHPDYMISTICTFSRALRLSRKGKYQVIHILDAYVPDYDFFLFASIIKHSNLVLTLYTPFRGAGLESRRLASKDALSKGQIGTSFQLWLSGLMENKFAVAFRWSLYRRAARRNRLAFICYTKAVHDSFIDSPFYDAIVPMFRGVVISKGHNLTKAEARRYLNLPQNETIFLHFGANHGFKNLETIFQAFRGLHGDYKLLFTGKIDQAISHNNPGKLTQEYGLQQNVVIVNRYISDDEVQYFFYAADALVLSHRKNFKGASGVLATAAQFDLPVITSDVGSAGEAVKNYNMGLTFQAENPLSLREAVSSFLDLGEEEKQDIKNNVSRFAQDHSWQLVAQKHIELYQGLMEDESTLR